MGFSMVWEVTKNGSDTMLNQPKTEVKQREEERESLSLNGDSDSEIRERGREMVKEMYRTTFYDIVVIPTTKRVGIYTHTNQPNLGKLSLK